MGTRRSWLVVIAGLAVVAAACGTSATSSPPAQSSSPGATPAATTAEVVNLVLRYCWSGEGEVAAMESIIQDWNAAHPEIQVRGISGSIKNEQIAAAVAGGAPPDMVIQCNNEPVPAFAKDGVILPLDDMLTKIAADTSDIIPASLDWVKYQDKLYGLPFLQDTWGLLWNTDAFTEVGLDPAKPPTTLDELWDYAKKLTKYNADGSIARAGFIPYYNGKNINEMNELFGCKYYDEASKKITVDSPECVAFFEWYKKWWDEYNKDGKVTDLIASKGSEDEDLFYTGKVAMYLGGEWVPGAAYAPNFAPDLKYDSAAFPASDPSVTGAGFINGNAFFIPKGSKDPEAATKFGMYLMTPDPSRKMAIQNASVPQLKSLTTDPQLTAVPHFQSFLEIANHPKTWTNPMIAQWGLLKDGLSEAWDSVMTGGVPAQQALGDLTTRLQADLDANGP